jgi:hypothetical protein
VGLDTSASGSRAPSFWREAALTATAGSAVALFCVLLLWQEPGFFWTDDYQTYQLAGYCDIARAWTHGEVPLLSPSSWWGGALAAEYQYGVFSVFLAVCVVVLFALGLPLPLTAALLSIVHLAVLAAGACRLARRRGLGADLAVLVALVSALAGYTFIWGGTAWFPALASFAWVPWVWWALERCSEERSGPANLVLTGFFVYLVITAGWPFSVLMTGILTAWWVLRRCCTSRHLRPLAQASIAWAIGLGLSAPAWMMLLEFAPTTLRGWTPLRLTFDWSVPLTSLPGLVFPSVVVRWPVFTVWKPHRSVELAGALVPLVILAAVLRARRFDILRTLRWEAALCGFALLLTLLPGLGNFQYGFRWLPLFFVALAVLSAHALALLRRDNPAMPNLGRLGFFLVLPVWVGGMWCRLDPTRTTLFVGLGYLPVVLLWVAADAGLRPQALLRAWMPCLVIVATCWLTYATFAHCCEVSSRPFGEQVRQAAPLDPSIRYFSVYTWPDLIDPQRTNANGRFEGLGTELYVGNTPMYSGVEFVSGYSPLMPAGLYALCDFSTVQGTSSVPGAQRILTEETGPNGLLELLAVDGLVVAERFRDQESALIEHGWYPVAERQSGKIFHRSGLPSPRVRTIEQAICVSEFAAARRRLTAPRQGPLPLVVLDPSSTTAEDPMCFAPAQVTPVAELRNAVVVDVTSLASDHDVLIAFSRPWYPGYRAFCNGRPVEVQLLDLAIPAVRLPAGTSGRVVLEYWPRSLERGCWLVALTGAACLFMLGAAIVRRPKGALPCST